MEFEDICRIAFKYCKKYRYEIGLCHCLDVGDYYIFESGDPDVVNYGGGVVMFDKKNCRIGTYSTIEYCHLFVHGKAVEIPDKYKFKKRYDGIY